MLQPDSIVFIQPLKGHIDPLQLTVIDYKCFLGL